MKNLLKSAALVCAISAGAAEAAPINIDYQSGGLFGSGNLREIVRVSTPGPGFDGRVYAGLFHLNADNGIGDFVAFCVDLAQYLKNPQQAVINNNLYSGAALDNMKRLFSSALGGMELSDVIDTSVEAAGMQVALWEIMLDSGSGFDLTSGEFAMSGNTGVQSQAQTYLDALPGADLGAYNLTFLESAKHQDVVTVSPVPLPASALLILGGLGGLAATRRRKAA